MAPSSETLGLQQRVEQIAEQGNGGDTGNQVIHRELLLQSLSQALVKNQEAAKNRIAVPT